MGFVDTVRVQRLLAIYDGTAGRADAAIIAFSAVYPYVLSGKLRVLAITKPTRAANYPDIPTVAETLPGFAD